MIVRFLANRHRHPAQQHPPVLEPYQIGLLLNHGLFVGVQASGTNFVPLQTGQIAFRPLQTLQVTLPVPPQTLHLPISPPRMVYTMTSPTWSWFQA